MSQSPGCMRRSGAALPWRTCAKPPATPRFTCERETTPIQYRAIISLRHSLLLDFADLLQRRLQARSVALPVLLELRRVEVGHRRRDLLHCRLELRRIG